MSLVNGAGSLGSLHDELAAEEILSHLKRIFASPAFRTSKRCHRFLDYVVTQTLSGKASTLKERTLAVEVFDRSSSWDSGDDTIVRVGAREVRKRLAQYYTSPEGIAEKIRIELHSGSYVPEFTTAERLLSGTEILTPAAAPLLPSSVPNPVVLPDKDTARIPRSIRLLSAFIFCVIVGGIFLTPRFRPSLFDRFWAPLLKSSDPVLVVIANPLVYHPSDRATLLNDRHLGPAPLPEQRALELPPAALNGSDMIPVQDQYVGFGDASVATEVFALLAKHSRDARLRFGSKIEFDDFRGTPSVLIGAFTNRWTAEFTQKMRFHFGYDPHGSFAILDSANPSHTWSIPEKNADGSSPEDYFLVCRLANSPSGKLMIIAAGITMFGTEAAGHFLTNPDRLADALRHLGQSWQKRNVELVFHAKVIGNSPSASELVAFHVW